MAYKPKYAQEKSALGKTEKVQPIPKQDTSVQKQKKMGKGMLIFFIFLGLIVVPLSSFATVRLMGSVLQYVGRPKAAVQAKAADMQILENFDAVVSQRIAAVRSSIEPGNLPELPEEVPPVTEEIPPIRKQYWIEEGTLVAPEPNQALFGRTDNREEMAKVLHDARWLLDGQTTYFQPEQQLYEDSIVRYYLDDSIFAITWQEVHDGSVYTFSEIKVSHPSQFRRHLAGGEYGSDMQYLTTEMAAEVNAVVASAGDFYRFRDFGAVVYQGQAKRVEGTYAETCYVDANGDLHFTYGGDVLKVEEVQQFVDERNIQFSLAFGPILVDNYEVVDHTWYGLGEINEGYARAALLQMGNLHYMFGASNIEMKYYKSLTMVDFAKSIATTGCQQAYALDGGQTATVVMNNILCNNVNYGSERLISDMIFFATAKPAEE